MTKYGTLEGIAKYVAGRRTMLRTALARYCAEGGKQGEVAEALRDAGHGTCQQGVSQFLCDKKVWSLEKLGALERFLVQKRYITDVRFSVRRSKK